MRVAIGKLISSFLFGLLCLHCAAQQAPDSGKAAKDDVAKSREALRIAEAAHPGNSVEVVNALDNLLHFQFNGELIDAESLALVTREVAMAEAVAGPRSKLFAHTLARNSKILNSLGRFAEARPIAERAVEIAQKEFPGADEHIDASIELADLCGEMGDYPCALRSYSTAIDAERKGGEAYAWNLAMALSERSVWKQKMNDEQGCGADIEEALAIALRTRPDSPHIGALENNMGRHYARVQEFSKAIVYLDRASEIISKHYGPESPLLLHVVGNLADVYSRTGQFPLAWKNYEIFIGNKNATNDNQAIRRTNYARSLASGGDLQRAIEEGLMAAQMSRESFVLQARTLPERQALAYYENRPKGLDVALSVLTHHPDLPSTNIYQEVVRSRALVADEMARREKNLNAANDPEVARQLKEMNQARADLLAVEEGAPDKQNNSDAIVEATNRMEKIERGLAERSAAVRNDERASAVRLEELRRSLPAHSALISYVAYRRSAVEKIDPAQTQTPAYMAFVLRPDSDRIRVFDLGDAKPIEELVTRARATADVEAHAGGAGSMRNERAWREAGEALRKLVWDPLRAELGDAKMVLAVPDGVLNLVPFSGLPEGKGYLVEHGPVIHMLSSERDLIHAEGTAKKAGLLAVGNPTFELAANELPVSVLRDAGISCENPDKVEFHPLPGTAAEVSDITAAWRRWNSDEPSALLTGAEATRAHFLEDAPLNRVLHIATHAFLLDRSCGDGNPLLRSGLVFAGGNRAGESSILTAQQIASIDLSGLDWAVLSACNTGNGELQDGEGVLGLERAFRVAGARSVVMTLWPVDDDLTRRFMHELYDQRLGHHASTADAVWNAERKLLLTRRAAGKSTHPWYWAGFVGSGRWE
jgi:CHAT domain-containing protein